MKSNKGEALLYIATLIGIGSGPYFAAGVWMENFVAALWVPALLLAFTVVYLATVGKRWRPEVVAGLRELAALVTRRNKPGA